MKTGLVLSGGGARCIAHLGLLQVLQEMGIRPDMISGVSAGALIGALYAAGHTPQQILAMVKERTSFSVAITVLSPAGLFSPAGIRHILQSEIPTDDFSALQIPLFITATDIARGVPVIFSKGPLYEAVVGSATVPGLFNPVTFGSCVLVDGGVMDNLPVNCLKGRCDRIIGSHVNKFDRRRPLNLSREAVIEQCFHLAIAGKIAESARDCDLLIEPSLEGYTMFETGCADELFEAGYRAANAEKATFQAWNDIVKS